MRERECERVHKNLCIHAKDLLDWAISIVSPDTALFRCLYLSVSRMHSAAV